MFAKLTATVATLFIGLAAAEHTISVNNRCGYGTPTLSSTFLNNKQPFDISGGYYNAGDIDSFIIYLQTGQCGADGESCITVEGSLLNGADTGVNLSLVGTHEKCWK